MCRKPTDRPSASAALSTIVAAAAIVLAVPAIYVLRLNPVAGLMVDDAWYILLAKALAEGHGFRLISSPTTAILPLYPPGFPALLSLLFRVSPEFPQNVWLLKSVSVAAMMGVGLLTYVYLHRHRHLRADLAGCAAVAVAITPAFVFLATSAVMSEGVFTLSQLASVVLIHRSAEAPDRRAGRKFAVLAAVLAALTMLVRSAAVALVVASVLWLLKERLWRRAALFGGVAVLCVLPWTLYARANTPAAAEREAHGGAVAYDYLGQVSMRWAGAPTFGRITLRELPTRIQTNLVDIFARDVGGILVPTFFRGPDESGEELIALGRRPASMGAARETMAISLVLSAIALVGFVRMARERLTVVEMLTPIALAMIALWPFWSFRFVLPLTPFLFLYFVRGLQTLVPRAVRIVLLCLIGLNLYDHVGYIVQARDPIRSAGVDWISQARDVDAALDWINRAGLGNDGMLATTNPALVYLRTGRKSIACDHPTVEWCRWKQRGVRYIVALYPLDLPADNRREYEVLYRGAGWLWVIKL